MDISPTTQRDPDRRPTESPNARERGTTAPERRAEGPEDAAGAIAAADAMVRDADWDVARLEDEAAETGDVETVSALARSREELAVANSDVTRDIAAVDAGWEDAEEPLSTPEDVRRFANLVATEGDLSPERLEALCEAAGRDSKMAEAAVSGLAELVGPLYAKRVVENPSFRKAIGELRDSLAGRLGGIDGPPLCKERSLRDMVTLHETVGPNVREIVAAYDLTSHSDAFANITTEDMNGFEPPPIVAFGKSELDPGTGALLNAQVDISLIQKMLRPTERDADNDRSFLTRTFRLERVAREDGTRVARKSVDHNVFEIPVSAQSSGLAASVTEASLARYDEADVDEITLHADLDVGCYAWASYGYGWDERKLAQVQYAEDARKSAVDAFDAKSYAAGLMAEQPGLSQADADKKASSHASAVASTAGGEAHGRFSTLGRAEQDAAFLGGVRAIAGKAKEAFCIAAKDAGLLDEDGDPSGDPRVAGILKKFDDAIAHPETCTPQTLAAIGKDGPRLQRSALGRVYTEQNLAAAIASGEDSPAEKISEPMHAGKVGLLDTHWFGRMELKPDGAQKGANRKILEGKLAGALSKKKRT